MKNITSILVDDETQNRTLLRTLLEEYCEGVSVLGEAANVQEAVTLINEQKPDVVFLDIEMPKESGFRLYKYFNEIDFEIVFTTAYPKYAIKAIKLAALDYLVKPIDLDELVSALDRVREKKLLGVNSDANHQYMGQLVANQPAQKIALTTKEGFIFVRIEDIVRCEADKSYTIFIFKDRKKLVTSKNLASYEELLKGFGFKRVHRSHLINPNYIQQYFRGKPLMITMEDGASITISAQKRDDLFKDIIGS